MLLGKRLGGVGQGRLDIFPLNTIFPADFIKGHAARQAAGQVFVADVRRQIGAIATREYIDPAAGTAAFALMFIPNEQLFGFIQELDGGVLAEALQKKVLLVVTDGEDTASVDTLEQAVHKVAVDGGPTIYTIGILGSEREKRGRRARGGSCAAPHCHHDHG